MITGVSRRVCGVIFCKRGRSTQCDSVILAIDALQIAPREKNCPGTVCARQTGLLPHMEGCPRGVNIRGHAAEAGISDSSVSFAVSGAEGTRAGHGTPFHNSTGRAAGRNGYVVKTTGPEAWISKTNKSALTGGETPARYHPHSSARHPYVTRKFCLVLLRSRPDTVRRFALRKTQTSSLHEMAGCRSLRLNRCAHLSYTIFLALSITVCGMVWGERS